MHIQVNHIKKSDLSTSKWSGGTTTQIAIFPNDASYPKRTFDWRISTATVEVESSTFTSLPGVRRFITSLQGDLKLVHKDHHSVKLAPYEVDEFQGAWTTSSYGKVTDFNLMLQDGVIGSMYSLSLKQNKPTHITFSKAFENAELKHIGFYAFESKLYFKVDGIPYNLEIGDFLLIEVSTKAPADLPSIQATSEKDCHICTVEIAKL